MTTWPRLSEISPVSVRDQVRFYWAKVDFPAPSQPHKDHGLSPARVKKFFFTRHKIVTNSTIRFLVEIRSFSPIFQYVHFGNMNDGMNVCALRPNDQQVAIKVGLFDRRSHHSLINIDDRWAEPDYFSFLNLENITFGISSAKNLPNLNIRRMTLLRKFPRASWLLSLST